MDAIHESPHNVPCHGYLIVSSGRTPCGGVLARFGLARGCIGQILFHNVGESSVALNGNVLGNSATHPMPDLLQVDVPRVVDSLRVASVRVPAFSHLAQMVVASGGGGTLIGIG